MATSVAKPVSGSVTVDALAKLRTLAAQRGFAKTLFTQGADGLTPYQITMEFKLILGTLGIQLPQGAIITLDAAQLVLAGGTAITNIENGAAAMQVASPVGATIAAAASLLNDLGIGGPAMTYLADFGMEAVNLILAIGSCGANIFADIGAIIGLIKCIGDLGTIFGGSHDAAVALARKNLNDAVNGIIQPQYQYAVSQVKLYQAGNLNPFDLIGNIALNSPAEFETFFPGLATFFPSWINTTISVTAESSGWFSSESDTESFTFKQLLTNKQQVQTVLVKKYLLDPMHGYIVDRYPTTQISLKALSALIMILTSADGASPFISFDFDILGAMQGLGLTPHFLGEDWLFQGRTHYTEGDPNFDEESSLPYLPHTLPTPKRPGVPAVVVNGKPSYSPQDQKDLDYWNALRKLQHAFIQADKFGDMNTLMANKESRAMLEMWAEIDILPCFDDTINPYALQKKDYALMEPLNLALKQGSRPISSQSWFDPVVFSQMDGTNATYAKYIRENYLIDLSDYWKCLSVVDAMRKANLFQDAAGVQDLIGLGSADGVQACFTQGYNYFMAKSLNLLARQNVSTYTGIPANKLQARRTSSGSVVFKTKET